MDVVVYNYKYEYFIMSKIINCGFGQALVLSSTAKYSSSFLYDGIFNDFYKLFSAHVVLPEKYYFKRKLRDYVTFIQSKKVPKKAGSTSQ